MALLPLILSELESLRRPRPHTVDLLDEYLGDGLLRDDFPYPVVFHRHHIRPVRAHRRRHGPAVSHIASDKDGFKVNLDVQQFKPEELSVKVVDGFVVVEGKHEERQDEHGFIQRQFTRRYKLPSHVNPDTVTSNLSSDGVLMVSADKKSLPAPKNERAIPIMRTQEPAVATSNTSVESASSATSNKEETMEQ